MIHHFLLWFKVWFHEHWWPNFFSLYIGHVHCTVCLTFNNYCCGYSLLLSLLIDVFALKSAMSPGQHWVYRKKANIVANLHIINIMAKCIFQMGTNMCHVFLANHTTSPCPTLSFACNFTPNEAPTNKIWELEISEVLSGMYGLSKCQWRYGLESCGLNVPHLLVEYSL